MWRRGRSLVELQAADLMKECQKNAIERGDLAPGDSVEKYLGFSVTDVSMVHRDKGTEHGVWFRLDDGRVIDAQGKECDPDRELYFADLGDVDPGDL